MKSYRLWLAALLLCLTSTAALASRQRVDETKPATANGFVKVIVVRGHLKIEGWDKNSIQVTGLLDEQTRKFIFDVDGNKATVEVRLPNGDGSSWWHVDGSDLVVHVPLGSRLDVSGVSTDTGINNIQGGVEAGTVSGDLNVGDVKQRIELGTVSGEVHLRHADGRVSVKSVSGDVSVYDSKGTFKLHSVSGDIEAHRVGNGLDLQSISGDIVADTEQFDHASGTTVSGDITIKGQMLPGGSLDFNTVSGSIRVAFKGDVDARFDLDTGSGSIRNRISDDKPAKSRFGGDQTLQFIKGNGKSEVTLSSRSGDIVLSR